MSLWVCVSNWDLYWTVSVMYSTPDFYFHVSHSSQWQLIRNNSQEQISQTNDVVLVLKECKNPHRVCTSLPYLIKSNEIEKKKMEDSFCYLNFFCLIDGAMGCIRPEFIITNQKYVPLCSMSFSSIINISHLKLYYNFF